MHDTFNIKTSPMFSFLKHRSRIQHLGFLGLRIQLWSASKAGKQKGGPLRLWYFKVEKARKGFRPISVRLGFYGIEVLKKYKSRSFCYSSEAVKFYVKV